MSWIRALNLLIALRSSIIAQYMIFDNPTIDISALPKIESTEFQRLTPAYKTAEYIGTAILFLFLLGVVVFAFYKTPSEYAFLRYAGLSLWGLFFILSLLLVNKRYQLTGYIVREHDVVYKYGVWWQVVIAVPYSRMQHCEISQGPVQNALGLATLRVFTAGGASSDLSIDGLGFEEAKRIKDFITGKISGQPIEPEAVTDLTDQPTTTETQQPSTDSENAI